MSKEKSFKKIAPELKEITKKIVKSCRPKKIILFGSYAWGRPHQWSDLDFLIIKKTKKNPWLRIDEVRENLSNVEQAMDILVYTPEELKRELDLGNFFIEDIINKGRVLYAKT